MGTSSLAGCTPGYLNMEGQLGKLFVIGPEVQDKMMRIAICPGGDWGSIVIQRQKQEGSMNSI